MIYLQRLYPNLSFRYNFRVEIKTFLGFPMLVHAVHAAAVAAAAACPLSDKITVENFPGPKITPMG